MFRWLAMLKLIYSIDKVTVLGVAFIVSQWKTHWLKMHWFKKQPDMDYTGIYWDSTEYLDVSQCKASDIYNMLSLVDYDQGKQHR